MHEDVLKAGDNCYLPVGSEMRFAAQLRKREVNWLTKPFSSAFSSPDRLLYILIGLFNPTPHALRPGHFRNCAHFPASQNASAAGFSLRFLAANSGHSCCGIDAAPLHTARRKQKTAVRWRHQLRFKHMP